MTDGASRYCSSALLTRRGDGRFFFLCMAYDILMTKAYYSLDTNFVNLQSRETPHGHTETHRHSDQRLSAKCRNNFARAVKILYVVHRWTDRRETIRDVTSIKVESPRLVFKAKHLTPSHAILTIMQVNIAKAMHRSNSVIIPGSLH